MAQVVSAAKHPNADKLQVCQVDTGTERSQVVCGAPNARAGLKGVFAPVGAYVPGIDLTLEARTIRGVESNGMLLLGARTRTVGRAYGIIELAPRRKVGARPRRRSASTIR